MTATLRMSSPLGELLLTAEADALTSVRFCDADAPAPSTQPAAVPPVLRRARDQLAEYFDGTRRAFDLPLRPRGTPFQRTVWQALATVPYGQTLSYAALARRIGLPATHARAVGAAVGRNPLLVMVPCHRVIGQNGALTGYAGGLPRKRALLSLEGAGTGQRVTHAAQAA